MPYGYTDDVWETARAEATVLLQRRAAEPVNFVITYSELTSLILTAQFDPGSFAFWQFLGEISTREYRAGHGMLTAIVVSAPNPQAPVQKPGPGFIECAKSLGLPVTDPDMFWIGQLNFVHDYWQRQPLT